MALWKKALEYFQTHDWSGDYSWHADEQRRFVAAGIALLSEYER